MDIRLRMVLQCVRQNITGISSLRDTRVSCEGNPILDTAYELGYADQSHLTRLLKRFQGYTPGEIVASPFQTG